MNWSLLLGENAKNHRIEFADIGCGYGGLLIQLSLMFPDIGIVGMEIRVKVNLSFLLVLKLLFRCLISFKIKLKHFEDVTKISFIIFVVFGQTQ